VGKELVASELAKVINQLLTKSAINPIQRQWKEEFLHEINTSPQNENEKLMSSNKVLQCEGYCCKLCPSNNTRRKNHKDKTVHEETAGSQGNEADETLADPSPNNVVPSEGKQHQEIRVSTRKRKPPEKLSKVFL
jgi:hypothetical protein